MKDRKLYEQLLGLSAPWLVRDVELRLSEGEVIVSVAHDSNRKLRCPQCNKPCGRYDARTRRWRHLDTMQFRTLIEADIPRVDCAEHGVHQVDVPWADRKSRLSALFETLVIDWLHEASMSVVARQLGLSWDVVAGVQARAVRRGLSRRATLTPRVIGVDETSFQKRHEYVTIVSDCEGRVLYVADKRTEETLSGFYEALGKTGCERLEVVTMDMWPAYIKATKAYLDDAESKIVFDKFHIAQHLGDAVDKVRRTEHKVLKSQGDNILKGSKYLWLSNPNNMSAKQWASLRALKDKTLRVARAWAIKEFAMSLWHYTKRAWADKAWNRWYQWAIRCRLEPIKQVARMIRNHWTGVINAATSTHTNARAESINSKVQKIKRDACGFRSRERFQNAIYFHLGGLQMYPQSLNSTHSKS